MVTATVTHFLFQSILDYNEADLERIYEEWEENDEDVLEDDEKPYHKRPQRPVDIDELRKKVQQAFRNFLFFLTRFLPMERENLLWCHLSSLFLQYII